MLENNEGCSTDRVITNFDDDEEKSAGQENTSSECNNHSQSVVDGKDPQDSNGRSADECTTTTDDGACVIRDGDGWITMGMKSKSNERVLTSNS